MESPVSRINPDLSSRADVTQAERLVEKKKISFVGTQKTGPFDLPEEKALRHASRSRESEWVPKQ